MSRRRYELVAFDMDGVLIDYPSTWTWVHNHFGVANRVSVDAFLRGEIDDMEFMRRDISLWREISPELNLDDLSEILRPLPLMPGLAETIQELKDRGLRCVIISGGLDQVAGRLAEDYGFDDYLANGYECAPDGRLTGRGTLKVWLKSKRDALASLQRKFGVSHEGTVSVGDSFIDVSLFELSALRIAFNPIDDLITHQADYVIRSRDLRDLLPLIR